MGATLFALPHRYTILEGLNWTPGSRIRTSYGTAGIAFTAETHTGAVRRSECLQAPLGSSPDPSHVRHYLRITHTAFMVRNGKARVDLLCCWRETLAISLKRH